MTGRIRKPNHSGSTLDSLLREDGILKEVEAAAIKRVKGYIDRSETLDQFLAKDGLLADAEEAALREIAANQKKVRTKGVRRK